MLLHPKGSKKKVLIIVAGAIVALGLLVAAAFWLKGSAETGATSSIKSAHTEVNNALKSLNTKLTNVKLSSTDKAKAFGDLESSIAKTDSDTCSKEAKNITFAFSNAKNRCDDAHKQLLAIKTSLQNIEESAKDDQTLANVLAPIKSADAKDAAKQLEAWAAVAVNIPKANISRDAINLKNHLLTVATSYRDAWKELTDADKAQNKTNYDAATKKIDAAKDELSKVATDQTTAFKNSLAQFKQAVSAFK
jgi:hypothetical protein